MRKRVSKLVMNILLGLHMPLKLKHMYISNFILDSLMYIIVFNLCYLNILMCTIFNDS